MHTMTTRKAWQGSNWIRRSTRMAIYHRDNFCCVYCDAKGDVGKLELDHVMPRSLGGSNAATNLVTCCKKCNQKKGEQALKIFLASLGKRGLKLAHAIKHATASELDRAEGRRLAKIEKTDKRENRRRLLAYLEETLGF